MTTFGDLVDEVLQTLNGYGLAQPRAAFLTAAVDATATTLLVDNASNFSQGVAEIGDEVVFVQSVDTANGVLTLSPDGRGYYGTTAAAHEVNARIESAATWPRHRIRNAINDVIVGTWPTLFGVASTSFTFNPAVTTYELPAEVEQVLSVAADTLGPSNDQQVIRRYTHNPAAPAEYSTGQYLTLGEAVAPGRTVTVTYTKAPTALGSVTDVFTTVTGLRQTAKRAVVLGACADLVTFMDAARLPVDTARADEYDNRNAVGAATRIALQLQQRFEMELEKERRRLRSTTPVPVNVKAR